MTRSLAAKAASGMAWSLATGLGSRLVGLVGTLVIANALGRQAMGEVTNAVILMMSAHQLTVLGLPHYLLTRETGREVAWHATVMMSGAGVLAMTLVLVLGPSFASTLGSPGLVGYLPGIAVAVLLVHLVRIPERLLNHEMRFREASVARGVGELCFVGVAVPLVYQGLGGMAVVWASIARSVVRFGLVSRALSPARWLTPCALRWSTSREMLAYGLPIAFTVALAFASRNWDNLMVSAMFGAAVVGAYNQAYNLADLPATQVGEHVGDVLAPSFSHLEPERRAQALVRSTGLVALVVFPMAIGLAAVSRTLVAAVLEPEWAPAAPMLLVLSSLSVFRPVGWTVASYLQSTDRTRLLMGLSVLRTATLFALVFGLGALWGPIGACYGVGAAFGIHALASVTALARLDGVPVMAFARVLCPPLLACVPMVAAVWVVRVLAAGALSAAVTLGLEVALGAGVFLGAATLVVPGPVRDLLGLLRKLRRG